MLALMTYLGIPPCDVMESPCVLRHNIYFRYKAPPSGCFQGDEGRQSLDIISCLFDAKQVSSSLRLFRNDSGTVTGRNSE